MAKGSSLLGSTLDINVDGRLPRIITVNTCNFKLDHLGTMPICSTQMDLLGRES